MKKTYLIALGLAAVISLWGINFVSPFFRPIPVSAITTYSTPTPPPTITPNIPQRVRPMYPTATPVASQPLSISSPERAALIAAAAPAQPAVSAKTLSYTERASLDLLIASVTNNQPGQVTGVFVPGKLSLPVLQQPGGYSSYVSTRNDIITQFSSSNAYETIGLLAHNFLSGAKFFGLSVGEPVFIVFGDGRTEQYQVSGIDRYQALSPANIYSDFIDLSSNTKLNSTQVFNREYTNGNQVVFQTCIEANGDPSWGRIFIVADKATGS
jgi:hypothetical protein